jgi:hypothetical protein
MTPPSAHAVTTSAGVPTRWATIAGFKKMPAPMMPPTTTMAVSNSVSRGTYEILSP